MSTNDLFFGIDYDSDSNEPINFLETRLQDLSPFSAHQIEIWGELFPTFEHAYQCARIVPGPEWDEIKKARSPMEAWRLGQKYKKHPDLRQKEYDKDVVVEELFRAKLTQHPDIKEVLLATKDRELRKVYDKDYYWGTGADGSGENRMGKLWMKLRDELLTKD